MESEKAYFAAGCFWGVEATFRQLMKKKGVLLTTVGYMGGDTENPTYHEVSSDTTGHAEPVELEFDPEVVTYEELVDIFFRMHDPTTPNQQGPDIGTQYRSIIFYNSPEQQEIAEQYKAKYQQEKYKRRQIVTEIVPAPTFYPAETYHQQYFEKNGYHPCVNFLKLPAK